MTQRKPPGMPTGDWIEALIRQAESEGKFDGIEQAPDPLVDLDEPYDENWWVRKLIKREGLSVMPEMLALKRDIADFRARFAQAASEAQVRATVAELNERVEHENLHHSSPIAFDVAKLDPEREVAAWREAIRRRECERPGG